MKNVLLTLLQLAVIAAKLCGPGGARAVIAENLLLTPQLIVLRRARQRASNLLRSERLLRGRWSLVLSPGRIRQVAVALPPFDAPRVSQGWNRTILNLLSFGEMPEATAESYARFLSRNLTSSGFLFEQNVQFPNDDPEHYCSPQRALARVFQHNRSSHPGAPATYAAHCLPCYGHRLTTCGEPSLWSNTPFET